MERIITTHEATIQTVQVEIKALKIGKKQVTMGLFRQLPYAELLDPETVQLRGVPWGWVQYWWDGDGREHLNAGTRLHVVWQAGDVLRRAIVSDTPHPGRMGRYYNEHQEAITNWFLTSLPSAQTYTSTEQWNGQYTNIRLNERAVDARLSKEQWKLIQKYWHQRDRDTHAEAKQWVHAGSSGTPEMVRQRIQAREAEYQQQKNAARAEYQALLESRGIEEATPHSFAQRIREIVQAQTAYEAAWTKQWHALQALPQLFIAV